MSSKEANARDNKERGMTYIIWFIFFALMMFSGITYGVRAYQVAGASRALQECATNAAEAGVVAASRVDAGSGDLTNPATFAAASSAARAAYDRGMCGPLGRVAGSKGNFLNPNGIIEFNVILEQGNLGVGANCAEQTLRVSVRQSGWFMRTLSDLSAGTDEGTGFAYAYSYGDGTGAAAC